MISIITPTIRPEGLDIVSRSLAKQTHQDWEWFVVSPYDETTLKLHTNNVGFVYVPEPKAAPGDVWTLNKAYNAAIRRSRAELIVGWVDYAYAEADFLWFSWAMYQRCPQSLYSHTCHIYADESRKRPLHIETKYCMGGWLPIPRGFVLKRDVYMEFEWNLVSVPRQALYDVGGFDEGADQYYGMNEVSVNNRIFDLGKYSLFLSYALDTFLVAHEAHHLWGLSGAIEGRYTLRRQELRDAGVWPKLGYLIEGKKEDVLV